VIECGRARAREGQRAGDEGEWAEGEERRRSGAQNGC